MKFNKNFKNLIPATIISLNFNFVYALDSNEQEIHVASKIKSIQIDESQPAEKSFLLKFQERIYDAPEGEESPWSVVPLKLISYPITKLEYEVFQPVVATLTESVTRNPIHNAMGTLDEFTQSARLLKNGILDFGRGILHPSKAGIIDGSLEIAGSGFNLATGAGLGLVKTVISIPAYPIARLFGAKKSERSAIDGKRGAIVFIDTGTYFDPVNVVLDAYGDMIIREKLNGIVDY